MSKSPLATSVKILLLTVGTVATAHAQTSFFYQAPTGPNGSWNLYEYVNTTTTFKNAHNTSNGIVHPLAGATPGYLTDIQSDFENAVVNQISYRSNTWIGLTDRAGIAEGAFESNFAWTNGATYDSFAFNKWNPGEPNNVGGEDATQMTPSGLWNDHLSGFGFNDPVEDPVYGDSTDETVGAPNFTYVRKWTTASETPLPNVRSAAALSFPGTIGALAPASTNGKFGVREIRPLALGGNIYDALNRAIAGAGQILNGQFSLLDTSDPFNSPDGGPTLSTPPQPFLSDSAGLDDNNIITIANGKIVVPSNGEWTIQVRSDDGFALRVVGQQFTSVNGSGEIDPLDPSTIYFYGPTGDSNTRGVLTLQAGVYDIEFLHLEIAGGAHYEVTTAKGAQTTATGVQWLAMGDATVLPTPALPLVRLTQDLIVTTVAETATTLPANTIDEARALINNGAGLMSAVSGITRVGDGQPNPFPAGTPVDNFAMQFLGKFRLDDGNGTPNEQITLTFALISDDGSQLRILGQDFTAVADYAAEAYAAELRDLEGDTALTFDSPTGNSNTFGLITLTEGEYDFEAMFFEQGGNANLSIYYSLGDKLLQGGLDETFLPLTKVIQGNEGWAVIPEPSTAMLGLIGTSLLALRRRRR